jgi:3-oxoacyl-[acyl-carrier-protein] synthase-3
MCYGRDLTALVVGVDGLSHITNWTDRSTCVLLGDGAGAVVLKSVERGGILAIHTDADGRPGGLLYSDPVLSPQSNGSPKLFSHKQEGQRPYLHMDGRRVYVIACETMARDARTVIEKYNAVSGKSIGVEDIAYVYPHQANMRIIETVAKKLGVPLERVYHQGIRNYGNTSTASIPIGYSDNRAHYGNGNPERYEIDVAFGAGFASGAILRRAV